MNHRDRLDALNAWLGDVLTSSDFGIAAASNDASFRRYYRVRHRSGTFIAMDAPPDKEDCGPFVKIAAAFGQLGLNVPRVLEADTEQGFLLLTDLGQYTYLRELNRDNYRRLYRDALNALFVLQTRGTPGDVLPDYSAALLMNEMALFRDWFLDRHLGVAMDNGTAAALQEAFEFLAAAALEQPRVWVHRDYHSRNLMVTADNNPGILDFQDAVFGPVTYDLVALLRDCYVSWPAARVKAWLTGYYRRLRRSGLLPPEADAARFRLWFDLMGVQRHLKAAGIFARLHHRDGKPDYLKEIPRTLNYVVEVCGQYRELGGLREVFERHVIPRMPAVDGSS